MGIFRKKRKQHSAANEEKQELVGEAKAIVVVGQMAVVDQRLQGLAHTR